MHFSYVNLMCQCNMCTTSGKWVVSLLQSFDFIKANKKKRLSFSTLPTTCTMANSTSFTYSKKLQYVMHKMLSPYITLWSKDWCYKVKPYMLLHLISLSIWTCPPCWLLRSLAFKTLDTKVFTHPPTRFC
jgi:hypothetical protein